MAIIKNGYYKKKYWYVKKRKPNILFVGMQFSEATEEKSVGILRIETRNIR